MTQATTTTRDNTDLVFCFRLWSRREIDMFRETFFGLMSKEDFDKFSQKAWYPANGDKYSYITALRDGADFRFGIKEFLFPSFDGRQDSLKPVAPIIIDRPETTHTLADTLENKDPNKAETYSENDPEDEHEDEYDDDREYKRAKKHIKHVKNYIKEYVKAKTKK